MMTPPDESPTLQGDTILISRNPAAGSGSRSARVYDLAKCLSAAGWQVLLVSDLAELDARVAELQEEQRLRVLISAGGDGTLGMLMNRLPTDVPLLTFPLGTENIVATYTRIPIEPSRIVEIIDRGLVRRFDAGSANGRLFSIMAGCGFDAEVVRRCHAERRGHISYWSYLKPIYDTICSYAYPPLRVTTTCDGQTTESECRWAFVTSIPRYAGGLRFAPAADPSDGRLDVCTFRDGSLLAGLQYLAGVAMESHPQWEGVNLSQATTVRIESTEPVPYQLDGDPGGMLPLEIECVPRRLALVVADDE